MKDFRDKNLAERLQNAAKAKSAILQRFREKPEADDPVVLQRKAERLAIAAAREARAVAKAREDEERLAREAVEKVEQAALAERNALEKLERDRVLEIEQKAARDARYATRKQRKA